MYRLLDRHLATTASQTSTSNGHESSTVVVFKCSNKESKLLVDNIRNGNGKPLKTPRRSIKSIFGFLFFSLIFSARSETRTTIDRRINDTGPMPFYDPQQVTHDTSLMSSKFNQFKAS
jgi:hypothetical protein